MDELIRKQDAIDAVNRALDRETLLNRLVRKVAIDAIRIVPPVQSDEKLEKCRFEYINACRGVTFPTPDTTKKDISDAYAVIKVLQPIFGDVTF